MTSVDPGCLRNCPFKRAISGAATRCTPNAQSFGAHSSASKARAMRRSCLRLTGRARWRLRRISSFITFAAMLLVGADDALNERMAYHVASAELDDRNPVHSLERAMGLDQSGVFVGRQIDLGLVAGHDRLRAMAQAGEKHEHLFAG